MTNPTPRPALRKAEDATVHPAAPRPARARRTPESSSAAASGPTSIAGSAPAVGEPTPSSAGAPVTIADTNKAADAAAARRARKAKAVPAAAPEAAAKPKSKRRKFSGSTSDHLRVPDTEFAEQPSAAGSKPSAKPHATNPSRPSKPKTTGEAAGPAKVGRELMTGKTVELEVLVPKKLRKAARDEAKRRGLDLDAVTTDLLFAWLTEHR